MPPAPSPDVHEEDDGKLQALRGMHGHEIDGIHGIDHRVGLVAHGETIEVLRDAPMVA